LALVLIAELGRPHGVRGLMRVRAFSEAAVTAYNPLVDAQGRAFV
jgi:ribosomal 30S subunit maturation factor RimM